jgi:hypothetical protein
MPGRVRVLLLPDLRVRVAAMDAVCRQKNLDDAGKSRLTELAQKYHNRCHGPVSDNEAKLLMMDFGQEITKLVRLITRFERIQYLCLFNIFLDAHIP